MKLIIFVCLLICAAAALPQRQSRRRFQQQSSFNNQQQQPQQQQQQLPAQNAHRFQSQQRFGQPQPQPQQRFQSQPRNQPRPLPKVTQQQTQPRPQTFTPPRVQPRPQPQSFTPPRVQPRPQPQVQQPRTQPRQSHQQLPTIADSARSNHGFTAARNRDRFASILRNELEAPRGGTFKYAVETDNGILLTQEGTPGNHGQSNLQGSFSFVMEDGSLAEVRYVADEFGFRAESPLIPTPPPIPPHALEQLRRAEEERARGITFN